MLSFLFFVLLALGAHAAPDVCDGMVCGGSKSFGLNYDQYCDVTTENSLRTLPPGTVSAAWICESIAIASTSAWYNYRASGSCEILSSCEVLKTEIGSITGPAPGCGDSCFLQEVLLVIGGNINQVTGVKTSSVDVITQDLEVLTGVIPNAPVADAWTWNGAALIGEEVVMCGGVDSNTECHHLNLKTATWTSTNMPTTRFQTTSILYNNVYYLFGGYDSTELDIVEGFFPSVNSWCNIPQWKLPEANRLFCAIEHNNHIYIIGGIGEAGLSFSTVRRLDTSTNLYETLPSMLTPRSGQGCVLTSIGNMQGILVTGGSNSGTWLSSTEFYSIENNEWFNLANMNSVRYRHGMSIIKDQVVVIGGRTHFEVLDSLEVYHESEQKWVTVAGSALSELRYSFAVAKVPQWPLDI